MILAWNRIDSSLEQAVIDPFVFTVERQPGDSTVFLLMSMGTRGHKEWFGELHTDFTTVAAAKQYVKQFLVGLYSTLTEKEVSCKRIRKIKKNPIE